MRRIALLTLAAVFLGLVFMVACSDQTDSVQSGKKVTAGDVKKEAQEALESAKTYTLQQKEAYQKQVEAKLQEYNRKIQDLQKKASSSASDLTAEGKEKLDQVIENLKKKKQAAGEKLNELKSDSSKAWEAAKSGVDQALHELDKAYERVRSQFGS